MVVRWDWSEGILLTLLENDKTTAYFGNGDLLGEGEYYGYRVECVGEGSYFGDIQRYHHG